MLNDREQGYLSACGWNFEMQALQLATPIPRVGLQKNIPKKEFLTCTYDSKVIKKCQPSKNKILTDKIN